MLSTIYDKCHRRSDGQQPGAAVRMTDTDWLTGRSNDGRKHWRKDGSVTETRLMGEREENQR